MVKSDDETMYMRSRGGANVFYDVDETVEYNTVKTELTA